MKEKVNKKYTRSDYPTDNLENFPKKFNVIVDGRNADMYKDFISDKTYIDLIGDPEKWIYLLVYNTVFDS